MATPFAFGSWRSPITAELITRGQVSLSEPRFGGQHLYWLEGRPEEGGRVSIVSEGPGGVALDRVGEPYNVRTRVHEYGGGAWALHGETLFFSDFRSGRLYRQDPGRTPFPITSAPEEAGSVRYADLDVAPDGRWIVCVRETHDPTGGVSNELVLVPTVEAGPRVRVLVGGHDFFSFPRISPDGRRLLWTSWDHPRMPWDGTDLWVADLSSDGLGHERHLAGGGRESIFQPEWGPTGTVFFVSDRSGWWNLYRSRQGRTEAILPVEAEFGAPQWVFGMSRYAVLDGNRLAAIRTAMGEDEVLLIDVESGAARRWPLPYTTVASIGRAGQDVALIGASASTPAEIALGVPGESTRVVRKSLDLDVSSGYISEPEHREFATGDGVKAFAFFYPPKNADYVGPDGERPPLVVTSHGGPTSAAGSALNLSVQFWTSRGIGVADVDYRGSSGYGRVYRESLNGQWGVADVEDCVHAARDLARSGRVDPDRMVIRGKSASGLTTLAALVFHREFAAGAGYYAVADPEGLVADTHKFESRYLDGLIGPYPETAERYRARSPLANAERLDAPLILFQGLEDRVVPPSQAEVLVNALREKGLPFAYLTFEGEQHGFRRASTIRRALEAELYFYSRILGFDPADAIEPVPIENAQGIRRREPNT